MLKLFFLTSYYLCLLICMSFFFITTDNSSNERKERPSSADRRTESPYAPNNRESIQSQQPAPNADGKPWNYPGLDLMATGAFWQNYSG